MTAKTQLKLFLLGFVMTCLAAWSSHSQMILGNGMWGMAQTSGLTLPTPDLYYTNFDSGTKGAKWYENSPSVWNYTPALEGTYSLGMTNNSYPQITWGTTNATVSLNFMFTLPYVAENVFYCYLLDTNSYAYLLNVHSDKTMRLRAAGGATSVYTVGTVTSNSTYYAWVHYTKGAGADAALSFAFATTAVEPTSGDNFVSMSNGASTNGVKSCALRAVLAAAGTNTVVVDRLGISTTSMPNGW